MSACKRDAVVVIQLGAYVYGVLTFYECLLSQFYSMYKTMSSHIASYSLKYGHHCRVYHFEPGGISVSQHFVDINVHAQTEANVIRYVYVYTEVINEGVCSVGSLMYFSFCGEILHSLTSC